MPEMRRMRAVISALLACLLVLTLGVAVANAQGPPSNEVPLEHIELRDQLIAAQESLLNSYRCQFDIDTHVVQGGCADGAPVAGPIEPKPFEGAPTQHALNVRERLVNGLYATKLGRRVLIFVTG